MIESSQIENVSRERQEAWRSGDAVSVARLTRKLADLYEDRRIERARRSRGSHEEIVRKARIEVELERLMSE